MSKLTCYTPILENLDNLKGIISDDRIKLARLWISDISFDEAELKSGRVIKDFLIHVPTNQLWSRQSIKNGGHYFYSRLLEEFFTEEEIEKINSKANSIYRDSQEKRRFDKAEKIQYKDWGGWFFHNDEVYHTVEDLEDLLDDGEELPSYVWAAKEVEVFPEITAQHVIESFSTDETVDWTYGEPKFEGKNELTLALKKFYEKNKKHFWWDVDYSKAIVFNDKYAK